MIRFVRETLAITDILALGGNEKEEKTLRV